MKIEVYTYIVLTILFLSIVNCNDKPSSSVNYIGSYDYRHCGILNSDRFQCGEMAPAFISNKLNIYHLSCGCFYGDDSICDNKIIPVFVSSLELNKSYYAPSLHVFLLLDTIFANYAYEGKPLFLEDWFAHTDDIDLYALRRLLLIDDMVEINCVDNGCALESIWGLEILEELSHTDFKYPDRFSFKMDCEEYERQMRALLKEKSKSAERVMVSVNLFRKKRGWIRNESSTFIFIYGKETHRKPEILQIRNRCAPDNINHNFRDLTL